MEKEDTAVQVIRRKQSVISMSIVTKRVAAYCRVSTDKEEQQSSLETQMTSFRSLIASRPGWELAGIYADEGLSGTKAANRVQFQRMIADCEAGKIDYIVTKSISRFARNTLECLQYVRKLKDMGIYVYFEKDRLDTASTSSEMLLSILAAVAQEESHNISENLKWGYRKRFQAGEPKWSPIYGYYKNENGAFIVHEEQARGVRRIFELYAAGSSLPEIIRILEKEGITAMRGGKWWPKSLATVLQNEKYVGDVMMQKSYVVDHLSHKKVKNDQTVVPSYYVRDHHEAIVNRKVYDMVQVILAMKDRHLGSVQYPYYGTLYCPICGDKMIRYCLPTRWHEAVWTCGRKSGEGIVCPPYAVNEKYIDRAVRVAYEQLDAERVERLAKGRDAKTAGAAQAALNWKRKQPRLRNIEYIFLDALVDKITFSRWNEAVIQWKFGLSSKVPVQYDKVSEIPAVSIEKTEMGFVANGEAVRYAKQVIRRVDRVNDSSQTVRIKDATSGYRPRIYAQDSEASANMNEGNSV